MKPLLSIYSSYRIMPSLQIHQLRVAAVAKTICDSLIRGVNTKDVVITCLFHDMGNIIKFDLNYFPEFVRPEGLEYWQNIKNEFIEKYGAEEHAATHKIFEEIGLNETQLSYLSAIGFSKTKEAAQTESFEKKICIYADQRVGPHSVLSLNGRIAEGQKRYAGKIKGNEIYSEFEERVRAIKEVETQIFSISKIKPEEITDESIEKKINALKELMI